MEGSYLDELVLAEVDAEDEHLDGKISMSGAGAGILWVSYHLVSCSRSPSACC